jgi:hypothetical protein
MDALPPITADDPKFASRNPPTLFPLDGVPDHVAVGVTTATMVILLGGVVYFDETYAPDPVTLVCKIPDAIFGVLDGLPTEFDKRPLDASIIISLQ